MQLFLQIQRCYFFILIAAAAAMAKKSYRGLALARALAGAEMSKLSPNLPASPEREAKVTAPTFPRKSKLEKK